MGHLTWNVNINETLYLSSYFASLDQMKLELKRQSSSSNQSVKAATCNPHQADDATHVNLTLTSEGVWGLLSGWNRHWENTCEFSRKVGKCGCGKCRWDTLPFPKQRLLMCPAAERFATNCSGIGAPITSEESCGCTGQPAGLNMFSHVKTKLGFAV